MFRVIATEGELMCDAYEMGDHGVELYDADDAFIGFVPFSNLHVLINEDVYAPTEGEPSIY